MTRVLKEKQMLKDGLTLVMGIIRKGSKPTKKQIESLKFLEHKLVGVSLN